MRLWSTCFLKRFGTKPSELPKTPEKPIEMGTTRLISRVYRALYPCVKYIAPARETPRDLRRNVPGVRDRSSAGRSAAAPRVLLSVSQAEVLRPNQAAYRLREARHTLRLAKGGTRPRRAAPGPPAGQSTGKYQVVVIALAPVFVRVVCRTEGYLAPEVQQLLAQGGPQLKALGDLERAGVEGHLQGRHEVALGDAVGAVLARVVRLVAAGNRDGSEREAALS